MKRRGEGGRKLLCAMRSLWRLNGVELPFGGFGREESERALGC
jgi:hypothetical protein